MNVVTWLWGTRYRPAHVNVLHSMVRRHYPALERFVCVTDESQSSFADGVDALDLAQPWTALPNPTGGPSCYRRLNAWRDDAADWAGQRFVVLDLDCVVVGDLAPLWDRVESVVLWRDPLYPTQYCGSMQLLTAGACSSVAATFDPAISPAAALEAGFRGSDQAWISYCLWPHAAAWTADDGVFSWRKDCMSGLPTGARIVFFHGSVKPWTPGVSALPWIAEHYR